MPPKAKITREMIIHAGIEIVREHGIENVNARTVSKKLGCSTQPVMYHFKSGFSLRLFSTDQKALSPVSSPIARSTL